MGTGSRSPPAVAELGSFVELLAGIVDSVRAIGAEPFIIPAMGSHGGAIEDGQTEILRRLGVREETVGAPVRATMQTRDLGTARNGAAAHLDGFAAEADGIIVLGGRKLTLNRWGSWLPVS